MIMNQGMGGDELRNIAFHVENSEILERMMHDKLYSEKTAELIDREVAALISKAADRAEIVIRANMDYLEKLKDALLEKETVEEGEVLEIFKGARMPEAAQQPESSPR